MWPFSYLKSYMLYVQHFFSKISTFSSINPVINLYLSVLVLYHFEIYNKKCKKALLRGLILTFYGQTKTVKI